MVTVFQVGSYNDSHGLRIDLDFDMGWSSNCDAEGCNECPLRGYTGTAVAEIFPPAGDGSGSSGPYDNNFMAFFNIHLPDPDVNNPYGCGGIDIGFGFQNFLAFYYALQKHNAAASSDLQLGGMAVDTCGSSVRVINGIYSMLSGSGMCGTSGKITSTSLQAYIAMGSEDAVQANNMLAPLGTLTVSPSATTIDLNDADFFLRTVPPDNIQAEAMVSILLAQEWYYVATVNSDNTYGNSAMDSFLMQAAKAGICVATRTAMKSDFTSQDVQEIVATIDQYTGVGVIVLFTTTADTKKLLEAVEDEGIDGKYIFLGSETWADYTHVVEDFEDAALGSITMKVHSAVSAEFLEWVKSLTVADHGDIPDDWFEEFWQESLQCRLDDATFVLDYPTPCTPGNRLTDEDIEPDAYTLHTIITVQMLLEALEECDGCESLYAAMKDNFWDNVRNMEQLLNDENFALRFTDSGYGDIGYDIYNFQSNGNAYDYVKVCK